MKKLIEYKLWGGNIPYFVSATIPVPAIDGKRYGVSKDTTHCYLPDTVRVLTEDEFLDIVEASVLSKTVDSGVHDEEGTPVIEHIPMTGEEKRTYALEWMTEQGVSVTAGVEGGGYIE